MLLEIVERRFTATRSEVIGWHSAILPPVDMSSLSHEEALVSAMQATSISGKGEAAKAAIFVSLVGGAAMAGIARRSCLSA